MSLASTLVVLILASLVIIQSSAYVRPTTTTRGYAPPTTTRGYVPPTTTRGYVPPTTTRGYVPPTTTQPPLSCARLEIPSKRQQLSRTESRRLEQVISQLRETWENRASPTVPTIVYAPHDRMEGRRKRSVTPFRKDYRQMTKKEMKLFHKALKVLKKRGIYDDLVLLHRESEAAAAHFGVAFLPWHREYLFQLEEAARNLKSKYSKFTVPFWDSCMDESLPEPKDCVVWTEEFWGTGDGQVNNGKLAKNWDVTSDAECQNIGAKLTRSVSGAKGNLLTREKITNNILPSETFLELARESPLESYHGSTHLYVGGHAGDLTCSPNDPVFFFLHAMFDCLWEEWATLPSKDNTYPFPWNPSQGGPEHGRNQPMSPFNPLINWDGFWTGYTGCRERPSKIVCSTDAQCKSPQGLLFCHKCRCHCKIRMGGDCSGLPDKACYCKKGTPECDSGECKCNK